MPRDEEPVPVYIEPVQLQRALDLLHDISDRLAKIEKKLDLPEQAPQPSKPIAKLLTVAEIAERLGVSKGMVYELTNTSALPSIKLGGVVRVREEDLDAFLRQHRREAADALTRDWSETRLEGPQPTVYTSKTERCHGSRTEPRAMSRYSGRGVCRMCGDDVLLNRDGTIRVHKRYLTTSRIPT